MAQKRSLKKIFLWVSAISLVLVIAGTIFVYVNINRLMTGALNRAFHGNVISDVYELRFENLEANIWMGSIQVYKVKMNPLEKPLHAYPYINSSFRLTARKMILKNIDLFKLLRSNELEVQKIQFIEPGIDFITSDSIPVFFPFTTSALDTSVSHNEKSIESYSLREFSMVDAYFHVVNAARLREFHIQQINISLKNIRIDRVPGRDEISYQHFDCSVGELTGKLQNRQLRYIHFIDFNVGIDSLQMEETADTAIYHFTDMTTGIKNLDVQTADSIYHLTMESLKLNYRQKSLVLNNLSFQSNISDATLQKKYIYRKENFAGSVGNMQVQGLNFDSLMYKRKIIIDQISLDDVSTSIYKDLTKPFPPDHRPEYLGQQIKAIAIPISIQHIKVTRVDLVNTEVKPDGGIGQAIIKRGTLDIENITNQTNDEMLTINADAFVENKAHVYLQLRFDYDKSQFNIDGRVDKFDLTDLSPFTDSYFPARIKKGMADGITFSGMVYRTYSSGRMKFLYHDLVIDMQMEDRAKWKSTIMGLAANTFINSSNPYSENQPDRVVQFKVVRDLRTGFINILVKSVLDGIKETLVMSRENKRAYKKAKEEHKKKVKAEETGG